MPNNWKFWVFLALVLAIFGASSAPALAEFFGCNDKPGQVLAVYNGDGSRYSRGHYTHEFAAQSRPRITIYPRRHGPGPGSVRHCRSWLAKEYRLSGPVIVPQMRCWWD